MSEAARIRHEQQIRELRAASIRGLSGRRGIQFRGPDLYDGRRRMAIPVPHLNPPTERGAADGIALRLRYTDPELHRELLPTDPAARLVFEMLEQFRVESLIPLSWSGVRRNVFERFRTWSGEFEASASAETAAGLLLYTIAQICRSRITADPIGEWTSDVIEQTRFGHHEGADAGRGHHGAASGPVAQHRRRIAHLGAGEGRLERARHLEPDGWHDDAVGNLAADLLHGNLKTLRRLHAPAKPDGTHLEARDGQPGHADELVGRLKGIEDGRQAKIEDVIQCQHMYAHGKYNIKYGIPATSPVRATALFSVVGRAGSGPEERSHVDQELVRPS